MAVASADAYFVSAGDDSYDPTEHSGGAWRDDELHLAPVAGLVLHHLERWREAHVDPSLRFSRFSLEVLGQIARDRIHLTTEVLRPGRTIELVEATAVIAGRPIIRARAWLLQGSDTSSVEGNAFNPMPSRDGLADFDIDRNWPGGFIRSLRGKQVEGGAPGNGRVWLSSEYPVVEDEPSTPLAHFARLLDTANGIAVREDPTEWMYPNVDWTLHLFRQPEGEWAGFDTRVAFGAHGHGLTSTVLHDDRGPVGALQQSLTVRRIGGAS